MLDSDDEDILKEFELKGRGETKAKARGAVKEPGNAKETAEEELGVHIFV